MDIYELERSGQLFEGWHVVRLLGEGGFGSVYEIEREEFGVKMRSALKVISIPRNRSDINEILSEGMDEKSATNYFREYVEELSTECSIMLKLKGNSNIVSFEDYKVVEHKDEIGWDILIRMEMLTPLIDYMRDHPLSTGDVLDIGISMCDALSLCKRHNIMHRDLKPANIFVSDNGDYKLGDFGIARIVEKSKSASTQIGTMDYIAPEIVRGEKYDNRVDIYSLGLVLYRLLNNNRLPFLPPAPESISQSQREEANMRRMAGVMIPKPAGMDDAIYRTLSRALAFSPSDRYQDPAEFCADLRIIRNSLGIQESLGNRSLKDPGKENSEEECLLPPPAVEDYKATEVITPRDNKPVFSYDDKPKEEEEEPPIQDKIVPVEDDTTTRLIAPKKKKSKVPVIIGIVAGVLLLFIVILALGSGGGSKSHTSTSVSSQTAKSSTTTSNSATAVETAKDTGDSTAESALSESAKEGKLNIQAETILKGDTVNTQFVAGGEYLFWAADLVYTSSDESVATIRRSSDGERYVVEGKGAGEATITGTYGEYTASATIRVIDYADSNIISELGYDKDQLYDYMVSSGWGDSKYIIDTFGKTQIPINVFDLFESFGLQLTECGKNVYYYSTENLRLGVDQASEGGTWVLTITDLGGYPTEGELVVLISDITDDNALCTLRIPVKVE